MNNFSSHEQFNKNLKKKSINLNNVINFCFFKYLTIYSQGTNFCLIGLIQKCIFAFSLSRSFFFFKERKIIHGLGFYRKADTR